MKTATLAEAKAQLGKFLNKKKGQPVVVTHRGKPVGIVLGMQDEDEIERLLMAYSPRLREILDQSRKEIREGKGIKHDDFWSEIDASKPKATRRKKQL